MSAADYDPAYAEVQCEGCAATDDQPCEGACRCDDCGPHDPFAAPQSGGQR